MSVWEALGSAIRIFIEKHLIPFIASIVIAIIALAVTPTDFLPLNKVGNTLYFICIAGIVFLLLKFFVFIIASIKARYIKKESKIRVEHHSKEKFEQTFDMFWSVTDLFSPEDRKLIREFVDTKNAPIERNANSYYQQGCLLSSQHVISTMKSKGYEKQIMIPRKENDKRITIPVVEFIEEKKQYILKPEFYYLAKHSMENYGRISHFD